MTLHTDKQAFLDLIETTSESLGIQDIYVEKDYWVTYVLKTLSEWDKEGAVVFKGGTSLSKAFNLIDRFSEDVDLVLKDTSANGSQIKKMLKAVHKNAVITPLVEIKTERTSKGSRFRKCDYIYPQNLDDYKDIGDANDRLLVELNSFGNPFPIIKKSIRTYIAEMLEKNEKSDLIGKYELESFELQILDHKRTFAEKLMGLFRLSCSEDYLEELKLKVRHFYDISKLMNQPDVIDFLSGGKIVPVLNEIYTNDLDSKEFNDWGSPELEKNHLFTKTDEILGHIESYFENSFRSLLYTRENFDFNDIGKSIEVIKSTLEEVKLSKNQ